MKKNNPQEKTATPKSKPITKFVSAIGSISLLAGGLWALMYFSTPQTQLRPYKDALTLAKAEKTEKEDVKKESSSENSPPSQSEPESKPEPEPESEAEQEAKNILKDNYIAFHSKHFSNISNFSCAIN